MNRKDLEGKTVFVTGASSGLGRATALELARLGCNLALIARSEDGLNSLAQEVRSRGGQALVFPIDVTDFEALKEAASGTAREFGGIDIVINNAAVSVYGEADKVPLSEMKRVMDVNYFGQVHTVRATLPFLERSSGVLVGVLSALSKATIPLQSSYVASKHALYGFYGCLKTELIHRKSSVRISLLLASSIASQMFSHAKTYTGYRPQPLAPIYPPERYVKSIVNEVLDPGHERIIGSFGHLAGSFQRFFPKFTHWYQAKTAYSGQRSSEPKGAADGDNLFQPMPETSTVYGPVKPSATINAMEIQLPRVLGAIGLATVAYFLLIRNSGRIGGNDGHRQDERRIAA